MTRISVVPGGSIVAMSAAFVTERTSTPLGTSSSRYRFMLTMLEYTLTTKALVPNILEIPRPDVLTVCRTLTLPWCLSMSTQATILTTTEEIVSETVIKVISIPSITLMTPAMVSTRALIALENMTIPLLLFRVCTVVPQVPRSLMTWPPVLKSPGQT